MSDVLRITWVKSAIGHQERHKATLRALGLRRLNHTVEQPDRPEIRGMVTAVQHLVKVEKVEGEQA